MKLKIFQNMNIFRGRDGFQKADLSETEEKITNPERGFFQIFPFVIGEPVDYTTVKSCLLPDESLVLVIFDLRVYIRAELPSEALGQMREILGFFAEEGKDVILRGVYDREGKAMEKEPSLFGQVSRHMEQIAMLLGESGIKAFVWQGLLVGNWGEMHGSRYLDDKYLCSLAELLQDHAAGKLYFAVRTPALLKKTLRTGAIKEAADKGWGLFNDALMGSETDCGTYSVGEVQRREEISYAAKAALCAPFGGEVVRGETTVDRSYAEQLSREDVLKYLSQMHVTYLNRQHDVSVLEGWKRHGIYDYVETHLGYRFRVTDVKARVCEGDAGDALTGKLLIENSGFAPIYSETESCIIVEDASGKRTQTPVSLDLSGDRPLGPDSGAVSREPDFTTKFETDFSIDIPGAAVRPVRFFLLTGRRRDGRTIRFANRQTPDGSVLLGEW